MYLRAGKLDTNDARYALPAKTGLQYWPSQNPWSSIQCNKNAQPWSQALRRTASRQRADHDPLLCPSAAHTGALARAISRRAAHGMAESIGDAVASPLPRSETHIIGVKSDRDVADHAHTPSRTIEATDPPIEQNISVGPSCNATQFRGLVISKCASSCHTAMLQQNITTKLLLGPSDDYAPDDVNVVSKSLANKYLSTPLRPHVWPSLEQAQSLPSSLSPQPAMRTVKMIRHKVQTTDTLEGISVYYGISISNLKRLNRLWHPTEMATRDFLYIPLRMCLPKFTLDNIEYCNVKYEKQIRSGSVPTALPIDLIEVVLNPISRPETDLPGHYPIQAVFRPPWPLVSYKSIQHVFSFTM
ncbi:hypothetical protein COEREDRAFT_79743 [Coemansia reversa NRRL 1564]|uniref:LysM domain-containing protein n=1 Tax=Coemansia reversa (strain ATCC 12441 / NRRL 1564) TaxID=763665 RepID=A0A2G5BJ30_COERN|nr:hypothetical protein COEREDRAFT_79743 [Coemansia reversa NRRL 1564]|eukprot:PIA18757.1 hypothetical protein COEREDRAFT_79743 [Coemansia reversa NRRL 1564]